jgi:hypothetical protein
MNASGRWTLITGASTGIGLDLARCFAADGDGLVLVARRKDRLDAVAAELAARHSIPTRALAIDLEDPAAPENLKRTLDAEGIALHTLVNNAGFGMLGPFATLSAERQLTMVQVNVVAVTALSRLFLPGMIERRQGGILNLASMAAFQAGPGTAVYYATKAYLLSLSEALHEEAKPFGVKVTALCPGPVRTEFAKVAGFEGSPGFQDDHAHVVRRCSARRLQRLPGRKGNRHPRALEPDSPDPRPALAAQFAAAHLPPTAEDAHIKGELNGARNYPPRGRVMANLVSGVATK